MSALSWVIHLAAFSACIAAPLPAAWAIAARCAARTGAGHLLLVSSCAWMLLAALAVVGSGLSGALTLERVLAAEAVIALGGLRALWGDRARARAVAETIAASLRGIAAWSGGERLILAAIACAGACTALAMTATPSGDYDSWMYQLPQVAEWLQHDSLRAHQEQWAQKHTYEAGILFYPGDWTALYWLSTASLGRDTCTLLPNLVAWLVLGLAARGLAQRLGADRLGALAAAAAVMLMPLAALNLHSAHVDLALGAELAAVVYLAAHGIGEGAGVERWLALALCGLLVGTKMSGIGQLAAPLLLVAWLWRRRGIAAPVGGQLLLALIAVTSVLVLGVSWYAMNWAETGNPLGFVAMRLLGHDLPGVIDKAYIDRTSLLHSFDALRPRHWGLLLGSVAAFCAPVVALAALAAPRLLGLLKRSSEARALAAIVALLAWLYAAGPWSAKHAFESDLSWWMGQQLRYTIALWAVVAALATAALAGSAAARWIMPALAVAAASAFPFCTYGWIVAAPTLLLAAAGCALVQRYGFPHLDRARALALIVIALGAVPLLDATRWRVLNARTGGVPDVIAATLAPGEPVAFWGSHQSWLLYGADLRRSVRYVELERCRDAGDVAAAMRAAGCACIALGPRWRDFDPERYRLVEDHPERFVLVHGDPRLWGMCVYRLVGGR